MLKQIFKEACPSVTIEKNKTGHWLIFSPNKNIVCSAITWCAVAKDNGVESHKSCGKNGVKDTILTNFVSDIWERSVAVWSLSGALLFGTPWTVAPQAPLSSTISQSLLKFMCIELVMPSNHLILCRPLLLLPSVFPSIRVFSNESVLRIR